MSIKTWLALSLQVQVVCRLVWAAWGTLGVPGDLTSATSSATQHSWTWQHSSCLTPTCRTCESRLPVLCSAPQVSVVLDRKVFIFWSFTYSCVFWCYRWNYVQWVCCLHAHFYAVHLLCGNHKHCAFNIYTHTKISQFTWLHWPWSTFRMPAWWCGGRGALTHPSFPTFEH